MNIMEHIINVSADMYLSEAAKKNNKPGLLLIGSEGSPFLRSLNRVARGYAGYDSIILNHLPSRIENCKVIIDKETCIGVTSLPVEADVDNLYNPGTSCVAEATYNLIDDMTDIDGKVITIVGGGHATKGLAYKLIKKGAIVTIAHSHTKQLFGAMYGRDIVVLATPTISAIPQADMIIDIGNALTKDVRKELPANSLYVGKIGKLTNAILLARAAGVYRER